MNNQLTKFQDVAFVGRTRQGVSELLGYDKQRNQIPKNYDPYSDKIAGLVAEQDMSKDLERVFQKLRQAFRYKRAEMQLATPEAGCGCIETPDFIYNVEVKLVPENTSVVVWERSVIGISNPEQVVSDGFAEVFDNMFDRIEFAFPEPIDLEDWIDRIEDLDDERLQLSYDSQVTYCLLEIESVDAKMEVNESSVAVVHQKFDLTRHILASFLEARSTIEKSFGTGP